MTLTTGTPPETTAEAAAHCPSSRPPVATSRTGIPKNAEQWEGGGKVIAKRNLRWSIFAEFLGFVVWQLWGIVVVQLPAAGFNFDITSDLLADFDARARRCDPAVPVHLPGAEDRRSKLDDHLRDPAVDPVDRSRLRGEQPDRPPSASCSSSQPWPASAAATSPARCRTSTTSSRSVRRGGRWVSTPPAETSASRSRRSSFRSRSRSAQSAPARPQPSARRLDLGSVHPHRDRRCVPEHGQHPQREGRLRRLRCRAP